MPNPNPTSAPASAKPATPAKTVVQQQVVPAPERQMERSDVFEQVDPGVKIKKMAPEDSAMHVTTLDDAEFREALDLTGYGAEPKPTEEPAQEAEPLVDTVETAREAAEGAAAGALTPTEEAVGTAAEAEVPSLSRAPETPYQVADAQGELDLPDLYFSFKANGKEYERVPLDKVVRFAQMGVYNAEKEAKFRDADISLGTLERRAAQAETRVQELEKFYERLLADPSYYENAATLYAEQNTPEQRINRAEERTRAMQAQFELEREELRRAARHEVQSQELQSRYTREREDQQVSTFVKNELAPAFEHLITSNPLVNEREVLGQYTLLTAPLMDRGRIPPERLSEVKALVDHDLTNWIVAVSADREFAQREATKKVQAARSAATVAKRQVARAAAPTGSPAPLRPAAPKKFDTVDDWLKDGGGVLPPMQLDE